MRSHGSCSDSTVYVPSGSLLKPSVAFPPAQLLLSSSPRHQLWPSTCGPGTRFMASCSSICTGVSCRPPDCFLFAFLHSCFFLSPTLPLPQLIHCSHSFPPDTLRHPSGRLDAHPFFILLIPSLASVDLTGQLIRDQPLLRSGVREVRGVHGDLNKYGVIFDVGAVLQDCLGDKQWAA